MQQLLFDVNQYATTQQTKPNQTCVPIIILLGNPNLEVWQKHFLKAVVWHKPTKAERIVIEEIQGQINKSRALRSECLEKF